jgi:hypothetical protein
MEGGAGRRDWAPNGLGLRDLGSISGSDVASSSARLNSSLPKVEVLSLNSVTLSKLTIGGWKS